MDVYRRKHVILAYLVYKMYILKEKNALMNAVVFVKILLHILCIGKKKKVISTVHAIKACGGVDVQLHSFSLSAINFMPRPLHPRIPSEQKAEWAVRQDWIHFSTFASPCLLTTIPHAYSIRYHRTKK
jgi:hypothetical protein